MESKQEQDIELSSLKSIERYLKVLVTSYPEPINQTELAKRAGVTRAAVSQVRDELIKICDLKSLAYEKKLILKMEARTGYSILAYLIWRSTPEYLKEYISSSYFDDIVENTQIYENINKFLTEYNFESYFSKEDYKWIYNFIRNKIISHEPVIIGDIVIVDMQDGVSQEVFLANLPINLQLFYSVFYDESLDFLNDEEDFIKLLELRDKIWYFLIDNKMMYESMLKDIVDWLEITDETILDTSLESAVNILFLHLIKKILKNYTTYVYAESLKLDVTLNTKYNNLGSIFHTS